MNERGIRHEEDLLLDFIYHYDRCHWGNKVQTLGCRDSGLQRDTDSDRKSNRCVEHCSLISCRATVIDRQKSQLFPSPLRFDIAVAQFQRFLHCSAILTTVTSYTEEEYDCASGGSTRINQWPTGMRRIRPKSVLFECIVWNK